VSGNFNKIISLSRRAFALKADVSALFTAVPSLIDWFPVEQQGTVPCLTPLRTKEARRPTSATRMTAS
jgi:hypothetical protein